MSAEANEVKREDGYYWIRQLAGWPWEVAELVTTEMYGRVWRTCGDERDDDGMEWHIGPRCINPIEKPLDAAVEALVSLAIDDVFRSPEFKAQIAEAIEKAREETRDAK